MPKIWVHPCAKLSFAKCIKIKRFNVSEPNSLLSFHFVIDCVSNDNYLVYFSLLNPVVIPRNLTVSECLITDGYSEQVKISNYDS